MFENICICGGGSLGHVIAGYLAHKGKKVSVLSQKPHLWSSEINITTCDNQSFHGKLSKISDKPIEVIPSVDVVLLCLPGFCLRKELLAIKEYLNKTTYVGSVVSSTGFFFEALDCLPMDQPLWGFQRVPFIGRVDIYGQSAKLLGYKKSLKIAVENVSNSCKVDFANDVSHAFDCPTFLLNNYLEASITNSNPILHTSRLYSMFSSWNEDTRFSRNMLFYEEWTDTASELLINMDKELFLVLEKLPVSKGFLPTLLDYYNCTNAKSLTNKLKTIESFQGILSPMKNIKDGWIPDFESRYFKEDFPYGLHFIWKLAHTYNVSVPYIDKVYEWGMNKLISMQ